MTCDYCKVLGAIPCRLRDPKEGMITHDVWLCEPDIKKFEAEGFEIHRIYGMIEGKDYVTKEVKTDLMFLL
jgi:hypothetical protein